MAVRRDNCPIHHFSRFVTKKDAHFMRTMLKQDSREIEVLDEDDSRNFECYKCRIEKAGGWKKFAQDRGF
jgi:hypothetical protein